MTLICQNHISHKSRKPDHDDSLSQNVNHQMAEARWLPDEEEPASEHPLGLSQPRKPCFRASPTI